MAYTYKKLLLVLYPITYFANSFHRDLLLNSIVFILFFASIKSLSLSFRTVKVTYLS